MPQNGQLPAGRAYEVLDTEAGMPAPHYVVLEPQSLSDFSSGAM